MMREILSDSIFERKLRFNELPLDGDLRLGELYPGGKSSGVEAATTISYTDECLIEILSYKSLIENLQWRTFHTKSPILIPWNGDLGVIVLTKHQNLACLQ